MRRRVLLLPGIDNSGPAHWQSYWERMYPDVIRVQQINWTAPRCEDWIQAIEGAVSGETLAPILVAHSLGCLAAVHWSAQSNFACGGMLLVAIPDPSKSHFPQTAVGFAPVPESIRSKRTIIIGSDNDPYADPGFGRQLANSWQATYVNEGLTGHLNEDSGLGEWRNGWSWIERWRYVPD